MKGKIGGNKMKKIKSGLFEEGHMAERGRCANIYIFNTAIIFLFLMQNLLFSSGIRLRIHPLLRRPFLSNSPKLFECV